MKKITFMAVICITSFVLSGCGEISQMHKTTSMIKRQTAETNAANKIQNSGPSIAGLEQYAQTENSKYYYKLLNQFLINENDIPSVKKDPATDPEAKMAAQKQLSAVKRAMLNSVKAGKFDKNFAFTVIKQTEENVKYPIGFMTELPEGAKEGLLVFQKGMDSQYYKSKDAYNIFIQFNSVADNTALKDSIVADIDSFLLKDGKWKKDTKVGQTVTDLDIQHMQETLANSRQQLDFMVAKGYAQSAIDQQKKNVKDFEVMLEKFQQMHDSAVIQNVIVYTYIYNTGGKFSSFNITVSAEDPTGVTINISKAIQI